MKAKEIYEKIIKMDNEEMAELYKALLAREFYDIKEYNDNIDRVLDNSIQTHYYENDNACFIDNNLTDAVWTDLESANIFNK